MCVCPFLFLDLNELAKSCFHRGVLTHTNSLSYSYTDPSDAILAIACAYHFHTGCKFMLQAFASLRPGGRLTLAGICFSFTALGTWCTQIITFVKRQAGKLTPLIVYLEVEVYETN